MILSLAWYRIDAVIDIFLNEYTDECFHWPLNKYKKQRYIMLKVISIYCKALLSSKYLICFAFDVDSASLTGPHMLFNICRFPWN